MSMRVPEPCKPQDEVHAAGSARRVRLVSNVVSFAGVRGCPPGPIRHGQPRSRTVADAGERHATLLESVLGATPQEFESPILQPGSTSPTMTSPGGRSTAALTYWRPASPACSPPETSAMAWSSGSSPQWEQARWQ
jgi:hypothetical protein